jgi:glycosyltransferase involved in cell wall biosynthesis
VLHILAELRPSGAEVMLRIAAPFWFEQAGGQAILATGSVEGSYADQLRLAGFAVYHIRFAKKPGFFAAVYQLIRRGDYDVVHIHNELAVLFYGAVARLAGIRNIIYTVHNVYSFTGFLRLERILMRRGLRLLGAIPVAPGPSVAENEAKRFFNRAQLVFNWCETRIFRAPSVDERRNARERYGIYDDRPVIATLGNCDPFKNHSLLLSAVQILLQRRQDWLYLHAGAEERFQGERQVADRLGIAKACRFLGAISDPRSVLWAADVFVMPSLREGFSIAAIEAAACGLPLVLSDVPGLRDLKPLAPDGKWVDLQPEAFADAMQDVHSRYPSGSPRNALAAHKLFSPETGAQEYLKLYRRVPPDGNPVLSA